MNPAVHPRRAQLRAARPLTGDTRAPRPLTGDTRAPRPLTGDTRAPRPLTGDTRALLLCALTLAASACASTGDRRITPTDGGSLDLPVVYLDASTDAGTVPLDASSVDAGRPACVTTPCDPRLVQACGPDLTNGCRLSAAGPVCDGALGTALAGGECATASDCAAGLDCFASLGGAGKCGVPCCPGDDAACGLGGRCAGAPMLVDGTIASWGRCAPTRVCDVLLRELVCDPGEGCYIVSNRGDTDCRAAGTLDVGAVCDGESACLPGLFCAGLTARTCVRICALGDGGAGVCPSGEGSCRAYPYSPAGTGVCS